jgi:UDP-N-acetylmuramyl tripeptide synthase
VTLALDPHALELMSAGRQVALVSGTNGKTTTTRLLAAALATHGSVTTNSAGANLLPGLVATLASMDETRYGALEVDEGLLAQATSAVLPAAVVLLNLSRDQLDRVGEVRQHAANWRRAVDGVPATRVVANADDPLVAWAAQAGRMITWVGTGTRWRADAGTCPACGNRIVWEGAHWACLACGFARSAPELWLDGEELVAASGERYPIKLQLPGWCNLANAAMAAAGAMALGVRPEDSLSVDGTCVRLLLAKNPAGWSEALDLIRPSPVPVVVGINARVADGHDPSWLWDVPFERLQGRLVVATGDRARDLAVRLRYAEVEHTVVPGYRDAIRATNGSPDVDLAANYTSFQEARAELHAA